MPFIAYLAVASFLRHPVHALQTRGLTEWLLKALPAVL